MRLADLKRADAARSSGVPEDLADRELVKMQSLREVFVNDAPPVIIRKPKNEKDGGGWKRVHTKKGEPMFVDVAYLPFTSATHRHALIATTEEQTVALIRCMMDLEDPRLIRGESFDDPDRWMRFDALDTIDGQLRIVFEPKKYADGKVYDVARIEEAD